MVVLVNDPVTYVASAIHVVGGRQLTAVLTETTMSISRTFSTIVRVAT